MGRCGYSIQEKRKKGNNLKYNNTHTLNNNEKREREKESNGMIYPKYRLEGISSEFCVAIVFHQRQNHCTKRQKRNENRIDSNAVFDLLNCS